MPSSLCKDYPILSTSSALFQDASTKLKLEKILPNPSHQLVSPPFTTCHISHSSAFISP
ncbi:hypothetical protein Bca101_089490 [Brassica carinata]